MSDVDKIAEARALVEETKGHDPGPYRMGGPTGAGRSITSGGNYVGAAIGKANTGLFLAAPALRDTVAALADLADAQAQKIARLREALERIARHNVPADDRFNGKLCGHGRSMDEDCNLCTAAYARAALGDTP